MNLVDTEKTPLHRAFDMVKMEAEAQGVTPTWSEIVGLVPERALFETAARHIQLRNFTPEMVLEHKVRAAIHGGESLSGFVASVASPTPTPGGGSVAAHVGALGAALAQMVAGLTAGKKKYAAVDAEMRELAVRGRGARQHALRARRARRRGVRRCRRRVQAARRDADDAAGATKTATIDDALLGAAEVPLETARACAEVAELALAVAERGNTNAGQRRRRRRAARRSRRAAAPSYNVRINVVVARATSRAALH